MVMPRTGGEDFADGTLVAMTSGQYWAFSASMKTFVVSRAAADRMRSHEARSVDIGFSSATCSPASNDSSASFSCK